jgi:GNAT superfamily N-acetyltransferase
MPIETNPSPADLDFLEDQINQYNMTVTGIPFGGRLACFERDEAGGIVAGLSGYTWGDCCQIEFLWVHERLRGQGTGGRLLAVAEAEAARRGCRQMVLDTFSFQAPGFYLKHGYEVVGVLAHYPNNHQKYYLKKAISPLIAP